MSRWSTFTACPTEGCDGTIEAWLEEGEYLFCCSRCDLQGEWKKFARRYRGGATKRR